MTIDRIAADDTFPVCRNPAFVQDLEKSAGEYTISRSKSVKRDSKVFVEASGIRPGKFASEMSEKRLVNTER